MNNGTVTTLRDQRLPQWEEHRAQSYQDHRLMQSRYLPELIALADELLFGDVSKPSENLKQALARWEADKQNAALTQLQAAYLYLSESALTAATGYPVTPPEPWMVGRR